MNILVVTAYPPVLALHGGGVRMYHNIRILSRRHRVRVLSFVENAEEMDRLDSVRAVCDSVTGILRIPDFRPHWLSVTPFLAREFSAPAMHRAVDAAVRAEKIDVIQCEYLQMAQFRRRGIASILTIHDTLSENAYSAFLKARDPVEKLRLFYRWMQMLRYETLATRKFDRVVTMTEQDAAYLRSYSPGLAVRAIPIGVDPEYFSPLPEDPGQPIRVLFVANFRHYPNVEAAAFLIRELAPKFPAVEFILAGAAAPPELQGGGNVSVTGYVEDIRNLYRRPNTIVAAPLFSGAGQRVKLLEAFSMACPVVTTRIGAQGFPVTDGREVRIAADAEEFAAAILELTQSIERRRDLGAQARRLIVDRFDWDRLAEDFLNVVEEAAVSG